MGDAPVAFEDIDFTATSIEDDIVAGFDQAKKALCFLHRAGNVYTQTKPLVCDCRPGVLNAISEKLIAANPTLRGHLVIKDGALHFTPRVLE